MKVHVIGWNGLMQSYSVVAETYIKALLNYDPTIKVYFTSYPYYNHTWKKTRESIFDTFEVPKQNDSFDITFKFIYPYNFVPDDKSKCTIAFVTSEFDIMTNVPHGPTIIPDNVWLMTPSIYSKNGIIKTGFPEEKIFVVPHCYEYDDVKLSKTVLRKKYYIPQNSFVFFHNSAITQNKNVIDIIYCFKSLFERYPHIILLLKGLDKEYQSNEKLNKIFNEVGPGKYQDNIIYYGDVLSNTVINHLYELSDCYLAPSTAEGFNLPVLESLCHGLPVICTKGGPPDEFAKEAFFIKSHIQPTLNKVQVDNKIKYQSIIKPDINHMYALMEHEIKTNIQHNNDIVIYQKSKINKEYYRKEYSYKTTGKKIMDQLNILLQR